MTITTTEISLTHVPEILTANNVLMDPVFCKVGFWLGTLINSMGVCGNILLIIALRTSKTLDTGSNVFIISLAVTDLSVILSCNVLQLAAIDHRMWPFDFTMCVVQNIAMTHFNFSSIVHIVGIAVYRYLAAASSAGYNTARQKKVVVGVFIFIELAVFLITVVPKLPEFHSLHLEQFLVGCTLDTSKTKVAFVVLMFRTILTAAAVILVIYQKIRSLLKRSPLMTNSLSMTHRRRKRDERIVVSMALILLVVAIGYATFVILLAPAALGIAYFPSAASLLGLCAMWLANSTNWIIYGILNKEFRLAYKQLFLRVSRRCRVQVMPTAAVD